MTREELIRNLKYTMKKHEKDVIDTFDTNISLMCKDVLDYLEQQPCDDCISRQTVLSYIYNDLGLGDEENGNDVERQMELESSYGYIKSLPSVTPKEKTGKWIDDNENEIDAQYGRHLYKCSECGKYANQFVAGIEDWWDIEKPNFCPNCGAKMIEPQESEVSN